MRANKEKIELKRFLPKRDLKYIYLLIPLLSLGISVISMILAGISTDLILGVLQNNWEQLIIHLFLQILIIGMGEETGWRGWLLPNVNKRYSLLKTMFFVLMIWTLWHFPILFESSEILIPWLLVITGATIILTWVWKKFGNNILLFAVIHGSINYPQFFWDNQGNKIEAQLLIKSWEVSGYFYFTIGIVLLISMHKILQTKYKPHSPGNKSSSQTGSSLIKN
ncbi:CPBP family intramembrane glutamic endopeptidase [Salegentibacter chungangensis]|uniref:CPBP family intramembrane glutamic endopeptidase n=1 Tax=Salegentibacter chungangensis TaxID=1335724 RepID=A0ABW3NPA5_9FLAO